MTSTTKARPILFSTPMVRALLAGTKTQTRRAIKRALKHPGWTEYVYFGPSANNPACQSQAIECGPDYPDDDDDAVPCPYGAGGDLLYVRETWQTIYQRMDGQCFTDRSPGIVYARSWIEYAATHQSDINPPRWRPSIHMPRSASRLTLRITEVRVQRLQEISDADSIAEGIVDLRCDRTLHGDEPLSEQLPHLKYRELWESINGAGSWAANPWVWAISFEVIQKNVTEIPTNG